VRVASYIADGRPEFGLASNGGLVDLGRRTGAADLREYLSGHRIDELARFLRDPADRTEASVAFLPVIPNPRHCYCVGVNYADHLREVQEAGVNRPRPKQPSLFIRYPETFVGHDQALVLPNESDQFDFEAELAVIIGKGGRRIPAQRALEHVAGYSCFNDGSIRDWQFHSSQVTSGKNFLGTGAFGPYLVTADDVGDVQRLGVELAINGAVFQKGNTSDMLFGVAEIVAYASVFLPLKPGDVIATGTPAGVGFSRKPPVFLRAGDVCEVRIEKVGGLKNVVRAEAQQGL
jgi:2-keto-4-pentenoate hydratase/2-oxohepta-3-ene-1,7-dioic acid hydratase in catechol pathway